MACLQRVLWNFLRSVYDWVSSLCAHRHRAWSIPAPRPVLCPALLLLLRLPTRSQRPLLAHQPSPKPAPVSYTKLTSPAGPLPSPPTHMKRPPQSPEMRDRACHLQRPAPTISIIFPYQASSRLQCTTGTVYQRCPTHQRPVSFHPPAYTTKAHKQGRRAVVA